MRFQQAPGRFPQLGSTGLLGLSARVRSTFAFRFNSGCFSCKPSKLAVAWPLEYGDRAEASEIVQVSMTWPTRSKRSWLMLVLW